MSYRKDPDEVLDYQVDWTPVLTASTPAETITTPTFVPVVGVTVTDLGVLLNQTYVDEGTTYTGRTVHRARVAGGTHNVTYRLTSRIVTSTGQTHERTLPVAVITR